MKKSISNAAFYYFLNEKNILVYLTIFVYACV